MWKKVLLAATGLLVIAVLIAGVATTVNADDGNKGIRGPFGGKVIERAAQILGIDKQKLIDAFKQAGSETVKQNMDGRFAQWVSTGKLTQAQADQYKAWLAARPAGVPMFGCFDPAKATQVLDTLLKNGKITQAQYDTCKAWLAQKPAFDLPKPDRPANAPLRKGPGNFKK
jgi:uncharacterized protein YggL (DUF469 family)